MDFSQALLEAKNGKFVTRSQWKNISVGVQFPDAHSANTLPYLYMVKTTENGFRHRFPLDFSCESIFAEDWEIVE